ncbi:MAG TPA: hypothetical protein DDW49_11235 [Deltaproteobacteria bacterium]|nr:hypothetical protein [Deltaproteobacteria bacterium]
MIPGDIPPLVMKKLLKIPEEDRNSLLEDLWALPVNQNKLAEIVDALVVLSKKRNCPVFHVWIELKEKVKNVGDKGHALEMVRDILRGWRYPRLVAQEKEFTAHLKKIGIPSFMSVNPSPYFEEPWVEMKMRIENMEDVKRAAQIFQKEEWKGLFKIL